MAEAEYSLILRSGIRRLVEAESVRQLSDQHLLRLFSDHRDEAAFAMLLRRHGPIVLDVCRGVLGNDTDAADAFQATFLVLVSKASSIRKTASSRELAAWRRLSDGPQSAGTVGHEAEERGGCTDADDFGSQRT